MGRWITVAHRDEISDGRVKLVECGRESIALFRVKNAWYAINNSCPHEGGPLCDGELEGTYIRCPWHGWSFSLKPPADGSDDGILRYAVRVEGDNIQIEIPHHGISVTSDS